MWNHHPASLLGSGDEVVFIIFFCLAKASHVLKRHSPNKTEAFAPVCAPLPGMERLCAEIPRAWSICSLGSFKLPCFAEFPFKRLEEKDASGLRSSPHFQLCRAQTQEFLQLILFKSKSFDLS